MGLLLAAMAGAGDAGVQSMNQEIEQQNRVDLQKQQSQQALSNAQALEKYKNDVAEEARKARADAIGSEQASMMDQGVLARAAAARAKTLDGSEAQDPGDGQTYSTFHTDNVVDPGVLNKIAALPSAKQRVDALQQAGVAPGTLEWSLVGIKDPTERQQALQGYAAQVARKKDAVSGLTMDDLTESEKQKFAPNAAQKQDAYTQAAIKLGYIDPKDVMNNTSKTELAQMKVDQLLQNAQMRLEAANNRTEMMQTVAQIKAASGGADRVIGHLMFTSAENAIRDNQASINSMTRELSGLQQSLTTMQPKSPAYTEATSRIADLRAMVDAARADTPRLQDRFNAIAKGMGFDLPPIRAASPTPAPVPAPAAPAAASGKPSPKPWERFQ